MMQFDTVHSHVVLCIHIHVIHVMDIEEGLVVGGLPGLQVFPLAHTAMTITMAITTAMTRQMMVMAQVSFLLQCCQGKINFIPLLSPSLTPSLSLKTCWLHLVFHSCSQLLISPGHFICSCFHLGLDVVCMERQLHK